MMFCLTIGSKSTVPRTTDEISETTSENKPFLLSHSFGYFDHSYTKITNRIGWCSSWMTSSSPLPVLKEGENEDFLIIVIMLVKIMAFCI
jgi:hypothetical protein